MMESIVSRGLVLRKTKHLDHDVKLTLFLQDVGKVMVISKGGQRLNSKLKSIHESFTEADFQVYLPPHGLNGRLSGGRLLASHTGLRINVEAFQMACRCVETVEMLLPFRAPSPDVYDILRRSLQTLQTPGNAMHEWVLFIVRMLKVLGHGDVSEQAMKLLSEAPLERCATFVEAELEQILPWRLKSITSV